MISIEVKTGVGKLEPMQRAWRERMEALGVIHIVGHSVMEVEDQLANRRGLASFNTYERS